MMSSEKEINFNLTNNVYPSPCSFRHRQTAQDVGHHIPPYALQHFDLGEGFVVVADSGLMSEDNVKLLRNAGYKYINRCKD